MTTPEKLIEQVRRRLSWRRSALTACQVGAAWLGLLIPPLLLSRIEANESTRSLLLFSITSGLAAATVFTVLRHSRRASSDEAARLIDTTEATGSMFLTSLDKTDPQHTTPFHAPFTKRLAAITTRLTASTIVPLDVIQTPSRAVLLLLGVAGSVALVPAATPEVPESVQRVREFLAQNQTLNSSEGSLSDSMQSLSHAPTKESLKRSADAIWKREALMSETERTEVLHQLRTTIAAGDIKSVIEKLLDPKSKRALTMATRVARRAMARALTESIGGASTKVASNALERGDAQGAATALGSGATATNARGEAAATASAKTERKRLQRILMTVYAQIGSAPPTDKAADPGLSGLPKEGTARTAAALPFVPDQYSSEDRAILSSYFEKRRWAGDAK